MGQSQCCTSAAVTLQPGMLLWSSRVPVTQHVAEGERWSLVLEHGVEESSHGGISMLLLTPSGLCFKLSTG